MIQPLSGQPTNIGSPEHIVSLAHELAALRTQLAEVTRERDDLKRQRSEILKGWHDTEFDLKARAEAAEQQSQRLKEGWDNAQKCYAASMSIATEDRDRLKHLSRDLEQRIRVLTDAIGAKLKDCRESGGCSDAALMEGEYCSDECVALARAIGARLAGETDVPGEPINRSTL